MSTQDPGVDLTFPSSGDLSAYQYYFVTLASDGQVELANSAGEQVLGVLQNEPAAENRAAVVRVSGVTKVIAGGSVTVNGPVKADANGKAAAASASVVNTSDGGAASDPVIGSFVAGIALESADASDIFKILICHMGAVPTTAA